MTRRVAQAQPALVVAVLCSVAGCMPAAQPTGSDLDAVVTYQQVFPQLRFERPIDIQHAGDGSGRLFVIEQPGRIRVFPNHADVAVADVFLDLTSRIIPRPENEEGLLGLAFHPRFKENGQFFVYYTAPGRVSIIARLRVAAGDPNRADARSHEELLRIEQPYWNHNGGTLVFGPDGMLYIGLGDGGYADDPHGNGQNLDTLLGKILRIDVDRRSAGRRYAVPADNPFVGRPGTRSEIWATGVRNIWRMAFDPATGRLWAGDVGQDRFEEVDVIVRGGNYGWKLREGRHAFADKSDRPRPDLIDPVWEYGHNDGKSVIGGVVYRGRQIPQLDGAYLCGDHVSGSIWALNYDGQRVTASHALATGTRLPITSFGADAVGEVYFTTLDGRIYQFVRKKPGD